MRHLALAVLLAGLLAGCELLGDDSATTKDTTTGSSVTERADVRAAEAQAPRVREILEDLWDQFDLAEKPPLHGEAGDGGGPRICTLNVNDHLTPWAEGAGLRVSEEGNPELEARQAQLVRVWLEDNG